MLKLQLRDIGTALPGDAGLPALASVIEADEPDVWHDSSLELQRGLDVVELSFESTQCDVPLPTEPEATAGPTR